MITGLLERDARRIADTCICGCGKNLVIGWDGADRTARLYTVRCLADPEHSIYQRPPNTRELADGRFYDVVTQQPVNQALARILPGTEEGMLKRVDEAAALAPRWARDMNQGQRRALAVTALAYGLDPLMEELILYQGKPLITIKGRRRKDAEANHNPNIRFRFLSDDEKAEYQASDSWQPGDLAGYCILTTEWGNTVEGFGKVTKAERVAQSRAPNARDSRRSPIVDDNPIEMWHKRAEDRARNMAYGPVPRPQLPQGFEVIEGEGRLVEELSAPNVTATATSSSYPGARPVPPPRPHWCPEHGKDFRTGKRRDGQLIYQHVLDDGRYCLEDKAQEPYPNDGAKETPEPDQEEREFNELFPGGGK